MRGWWIVALAACAEPAPSGREARLIVIRDQAAALGVTNGALIGGIAVSESQVAHCWADARYACQGPASPSCGGGPILAGSADGPCSDRQGGLGMFQLDAGTWDDTIARDGEASLTIEGNTAAAVRFVIAQVARDVPDAASPAAWINGVPLVAGDPALDRWAALLACRYNGCCAATATCQARGAAYRDHALELTAELGARFWAGR
jgi:hypothetical protein